MRKRIDGLFGRNSSRGRVLGGLFVAAALVLAACQSALYPTATLASPTQAPAASGATQAPIPVTAGAVIVDMAQNSKLGQLLVDGQGRTLYDWKNDAPGVSNCYDQCAVNWPPLLVSDASHVTAGQGVSGALGAIQRKDGSYQVTYNDLPLYYFKGDANPGDTNGQGIGNTWYVVPPAAGGPSTSPTSTPGSAGYGGNYSQ